MPLLFAQRQGIAYPWRLKEVGAMRDMKGIVFLGVVGSALILLYGSEALKHARQDEAYNLVATWRNQLEADKDEKGNVHQWPGDTLPERDPWGSPLRVRYQTYRGMVTITVSSDGPDHKQWSPDDVTVTTSTVDWR